MIKAAIFDLDGTIGDTVRNPSLTVAIVTPQGYRIPGISGGKL